MKEGCGYPKSTAHGLYKMPLLELADRSTQGVRQQLSGARAGQRHQSIWKEPRAPHRPQNHVMMQSNCGRHQNESTLTVAGPFFRGGWGGGGGEVASRGLPLKPAGGGEGGLVGYRVVQPVSSAISVVCMEGSLNKRPKMIPFQSLTWASSSCYLPLRKWAEWLENSHQQVGLGDAMPPPNWFACACSATK